MNFSITEALKFGVDTFKKKGLSIFLILIIPICFYFLLNIIANFDFLPQNIDFLFNVLAFCFNIYFALLFIKAFLTVFDGKNLNFACFFSIDLRQFFQSLIANLLILLLVIIIIIPFLSFPIMLLIISIFPFFLQLFFLLLTILLSFLAIIIFIVFSIRISFFQFLIFDKNLGAIEAINESFRITKGYVFQLFIFHLITFCVGILGLLFFIVGIIPVSIVMGLAYTYIYRKLIETKDNLDIINNDNII